MLNTPALGLFRLLAIVIAIATVLACSEIWLFIPKAKLRSKFRVSFDTLVFTPAVCPCNM